jgi:hypothetical protein
LRDLQNDNRLVNRWSRRRTPPASGPRPFR